MTRRVAPKEEGGRFLRNLARTASVILLRDPRCAAYLARTRPLFPCVRVTLPQITCKLRQHQAPFPGQTQTYPDLRALPLGVSPVHKGHLFAAVECGICGGRNALDLDERGAGIGVSFAALVRKVASL